MDLFSFIDRQSLVRSSGVYAPVLPPVIRLRSRTAPREALVVMAA
jgi:hypothetical protein